MLVEMLSLHVCARVCVCVANDFICQECMYLRVTSNSLNCVCQLPSFDHSMIY